MISTEQVLQKKLFNNIHYISYHKFSTTEQAASNPDNVSGIFLSSNMCEEPSGKRSFCPGCKHPCQSPAELP